MKKISEYLIETIKTKRNLKKQNDKLIATIQERDLNLKDIIKERDMYKTKLRLLKREYIEYQKESKQIIEEFTKELEKVSK